MFVSDLIISIDRFFRIGFCISSPKIRISFDPRIERDPNFWTRYAKPNTEKAVDAYYEIANKHGLDLAQMSLKFLEIQPFVTSVIIGATTMEQLKSNIESVNINLSDDVIKEINNVQTIYPNPCP